MKLKRGGWALVQLWLACGLLPGMGWRGETMQAQVLPAAATTLIADTVYKGDGSVATGTVLISWPAFTTAAGASVPAGSTAVTIGAGGALSVRLVPNAGSNPIGSYYTVVYHLGDGSVTREYWVVPVNASAVTVGAIRNTVLPTSVAMQTASRAYVDQAIAAKINGGAQPADTTGYVRTTGDTMTGPLNLPGDPVAPLQAADKQYVDAQVSAVGGGAGGKVSLVPSGTQKVVQPAGTELTVNILNDVLDANQYVSGNGNNGIANATANADCTSGCDVKVDQNYGTSEMVAPTTWKNQTHVDDHRGGTTTESFTNPTGLANPGVNTAKSVTVISTQDTKDVKAATGSGNVFSRGLSIVSQALTGGSNVFPEDVQGSVPYFKTTYTGLDVEGTNNTPGQHVLVTEQQDCYGVGDCLMGGMFMRASGGFRDNADEGAHPFDRQFTEDPRVFQGSCAGGCTTGATTLQVAVTANGGTQGEGRYLLDKNPAKVISNGTLTSGSNNGRQPAAMFAGTSFPLSTLLATAQVVPTQANQIAPGLVTVAILTSSVPPGFAASTAALPASSGVACVADPTSPAGGPMNFETATYSVVDGSHVQLNLNRPHKTGATIAVGGLCGYGLEQTVDTVNGIRQVFPVIGSTSATSLLYAGGATSVVGQQNGTSAYANLSLVVASIARTGNVVRVTTAGNLSSDLNGLTLTVQGVADSSYNGSFAVKTTAANALSYTQSGPDSTTSGGTLTFTTGSYALYPMAEVTGVFNTTTKAVDGQLKLAANTVNWATNDPVEEPHYFQEQVSADTDYVTQYVPRPAVNLSAGLNYLGNNGPGMTGWQVTNGVAASNYFGNGGTHSAPTTGMRVDGVWRRSVELEAGEDAAVLVHCNSHGCDAWNSGYDLFQMDTSAGPDRLNYSPATSTLTFALRGTGYQFTPLGLTAGTINVTTLNAGTIHGNVAASSLPVFGASGVAHAVGAVPDPGAVTGTSRYLREDGTWATAQTNVVTAAGGYTVAGPANFPQRSALLAEYLLTEGSGTVAHDTSGNGNDGTINGATWEGIADLNFTSTGKFIQMPTAVNPAQTWQFAIYQAPFGTQTYPLAPGYGQSVDFPFNPSLLSSTGDGVTFIQNSVSGAKSSRFMAFNTDGTESTQTLPVGWHVVTLVCGGGGTPAHYLYDGREVGGYVQQGTGTCPLPSTGNFQIGGSAKYTGTWFTGKVAAAWAWSTRLSVNEASIAGQSALDYIHTKGVPTGYGSVVQPTPVILAGMDSRTAGVGTTQNTVWPNAMTLTDTSYARVNLGSAGALVFDVCTQFPVLYGQQVGTGSGPSIVVLWGGVNDILNKLDTRAIANSLRCVVQEAKATGARVVLATEISAYLTGDAGKNALNPIVRAEAFGWGVDNIADLATDPRIGADGAYKDTSCFPDGLHPNPSCEANITAVMQDAVNELLGSTETARHQTTAASYSEVAGDRYLDLTGTAAQTVTLPSCTGYSLPRQVLNLGSATATVSAVGGQTLLGSSAIAAGARGVFLPVPGAVSTGGCTWERTQ